MENESASVQAIAIAVPALLVLGVFGLGLKQTFSLPEPIMVEAAATVEENEGPDLEYYKIYPAILTTLPGGPGTVSIEVALAVDKSLKPTTKQTTQITEGASHLIALLGEVTRQIGEGAETLDELLKKLPPAYRDTLNQVLGNEETPEPIFEVLISAAAGTH